MPTEPFETVAARIAAEPAHRQVSVPKIALDVSLRGVFARLQEILDAAHKSGQLSDGDYAQIQEASQKITAVLGKMDEPKLRSVLAAHPTLRFGRLQRTVR